jgi:hypothetical protein
MREYYWGDMDSDSTTWGGNYDDNWGSPTQTIPILNSNQPDDWYQKMLEAIALFEESRNWNPAPIKILPIFNLNPFCLFNRRIAPAFWTGKNFKKKGV